MIEIKNLSFSFDSNLIIDDLDLKISGSEIVTIVGPTGCGKSTFLRLIAGLEQPQCGTINIDHSVGSANNLRFLFQDYDAFPWFTAWENVKNSAPRRNYPDDNKVNTILQRVGLFDSKDRFPNELSGGMRKRLALARCLVTNPQLLLLDEPFSKLDVEMKADMYSLLQELQRELNQTIIFVTHDLHEAILLGSRILVATHLPFNVKKIIDVPFGYPRLESIVNTKQYAEIMRDLREALRVS